MASGASMVSLSKWFLKIERSCVGAWKDARVHGSEMFSCGYLRPWLLQRVCALKLRQFHPPKTKHAKGRWNASCFKRERQADSRGARKDRDIKGTIAMMRHMD